MISIQVFSQEKKTVYKPGTYLEITQEHNDTEVFQIIFYSYAGNDKIFPHGSVGFFCFQKCFGNPQFQVLGFYPTEEPDKNLKWIWKFFPGKIFDDINIQPDYGLAINVSRNTFLKAISVLEKNKSSKRLEYNLALNSCIAFMGEIANSLELNAPLQTFKTPNGYLERLYELNK